MNKKLTHAISLLTMTSTLAGCQLTAAEQDALEYVFASENSSYAEPVGVPAPRCHVERYTQPEGEVTKSVDLLFVSDTSGSLDTERGVIADGIDSFVAELPSDVDYRIAVMLGHGSRSSHSGQLYQKGSRGPVLDSRTMTLSRIRTDLRYLLTNQTTDWHGDGGEEMLYSIQRSFDYGKLTSNRAKGFLREDAALAVVFVTDENDICATFPAGVVPVGDPDRLEAPAKARDCGGVSPESVLAGLRALQGDRPLLVGAIAYNNHATYPRHGENEYGYGILDLVALAGGVSVDLAGTHYNTGLAEIGRLTTLKLQLRLDFALAGTDVDPLSIEARVDGQPVAFTYAGSSNEVHLSDGGRARSVIDISYCERAPAPEPTPAPSPTPFETPSPEPTAEPTGEPEFPTDPEPAPASTSTPTPDPSPMTEPTPTPTPSPEPTPSNTPGPDPTSDPSPEPSPCEGPGCGGVIIGV